MWRARTEVEAFAAELRSRGYRVSEDVLLDVGRDGCFAGHAVVRACAVAPTLPREEAVALVAAAIGCRRTA